MNIVCLQNYNKYNTYLQVVLLGAKERVHFTTLNIKFERILSYWWNHMQIKTFKKYTLF